MTVGTSKLGCCYELSSTAWELKNYRELSCKSTLGPKILRDIDEN